MKITVTPYLDKRKMNNDGKAPIYIRLTQQRQSRYISTGIYIEEKDWNANRREVKKSHRHAKNYNALIQRKVYDLQNKSMQVGDEAVTDTAQLKASVTKGNRDSVLKHAEEHHEKLSNAKRYWEWKKFGTIIIDLSFYHDLSRITLSKIDTQFIEGFQEHLLQKVGNNAKTTRRKLSSLKAFTDDLIKSGKLKKDPFLQVKLVTGRSLSKTRLTYEQIIAIKELKLKRGTALWHTRNYFLYSFYNAGIRFGDICTLQWKNIVDGRLIYSMNKTGGGKSIKQGNDHNHILGFYRTPKVKPEDYIFPILKKNHTDPMELRREISSRNVVVNKNLKIIAGLAGIQSNVSFHVARHSFSQHALKSGIDIYSISKALGHSDIEVTQEYLASFDEDMLDKSMDKLFGEKP